VNRTSALGAITLLLTFGAVAVTLGHELDADRQVLIGGDRGLRDHPLRYQAGQRRRCRVR
jgi:hypothetical protein